jgi:hypothetical protein
MRRLALFQNLSLLALFSLGLTCCSENAPKPQTLSVEDFKSPDKTFYPKTWMHAMNGNLSKAGYSKDMEAIAEAGMGGAILFHVHRQNWPFSSRGPVRFGTQDFNDTIVHALGEADKHGLEMGLHNADGWSSSGGPWITPEMSMKRITWSEDAATGGQIMMPKQPGFEEGFYKDIAVIAIPENRFNQHNHFAEAKITSSDPALDTELLKDSDWDTEFIFSKNTTDNYWLQVEVNQPATLRSLQIETPSRHGDASLEISDDGINFTVAENKLRRPRTGARTWAFSPVFEGHKAKYFRFVFTKPIGIKRFDLWSVPRFDHWLSMNAMERGRLTITPVNHQKLVTKAKDVKVLNRGIIPKQGLEIPKGNWRILRFGYTSTGAKNIPATVEGTGLECDKFDPAALQFHFENYVGKIAKQAQAKGYKSLKFSEIDSYEMGGQNWTKGIEQSFQQKFDYDIVPWLPLLTGRVIETPAHSGAILQDFRRHLSDLMVTHYFGEFTKMTQKYGMESYIEPYGWGPFDELEAGGKADRLMGEFWVRDEDYPGRVSAAISSAHIYGKNIISAESFTSINTVNWKGHPYFYKHYGDKIWARGINETMFHRYAHQPNTHVKPGMTMDSIGSHIDRTQTWWDNGAPIWFEYLSRGSYLLQQGVPASDFLIHLGDMAPKAVGNKNNTNVPDGFNYDYVNTDVLVNRIRVEDGLLVLPEGTRYKALHLHQTEYLTMDTLTRVQELVDAGAVVIGFKPQKVIGYSEWPQADKFAAITNKLWGETLSSAAAPTDGKGRVIASSLDDAITALGYQPALKINNAPVKLFAQRRIGENDLYFFYNDKPEFSYLDVDMRSAGGQPETWNIDDGSIEKISNYTQENGRTATRLLLEPYGSRFILMRRNKDTPEYKGTYSSLVKSLYDSQTPLSSAKNIIDLTGEWDVEFDPAWGGPGHVKFGALMDWKNHPEEGIKHFSGTAIYKKTFSITQDDLEKDGPLYLDLGEVQQIAEITLNGQKMATLWKPPFAVDIRSALVKGTNKLEIDVTNTWVNRLIGDEALPDTSGYSMTGDTVPWINNNELPPESERVTFTGFNFFRKEESRVLQSSGLLGPVRLIQTEK